MSAPGLRPFLSYYGGKFRAAPLYPTPVHERIVEPFAGAAGYATRYPHRQVTLIEKSPAIAGVWDYLIHARESEVRGLPLLGRGEDVRELRIAPEAKNLIGMWVNNASAAPRNFLTKWSIERPNGFWGEAVRERLASQLHAIRHWVVINGDYRDAPDVEATWFIDPPYAKAGVHYPFGAKQIDFKLLGEWCRTRSGQTIVCENDGADWLPFQPFARIQSNPSSRGKGVSSEAIWLNTSPPKRTHALQHTYARYNSMSIIHANALHSLYRHAAVDADCMIVDPPYAPKVHSKAVSAGTGGAGVRKRDLGFGHLTPELMLRIAEYAAQVRRWSVVFTDRETTHLWRAAMHLQGVEYVRTIPWVRWSQPQMSGDRPPTGAEDVILFHRAAGRKRNGDIIPIQKRWNGPGNRIAYRAEYLDLVDAEPLARELYDAKSLRGVDKYSCEKPLDLMLALVSDYSDPGELVFDPCAGVGTTLVAAQLLEREAFGIERNAEPHARVLTRMQAFADGALSERDDLRAARWIAETQAEARKVPAPKGAHDVRTYERAQRRLADAERVLNYGSV